MKTKLTMIMLIATFLCAEAQEWTWSEDTLSYAREGLSATTLDDSLFFSGGRLYNYSYVNTVDIYDVGLGEWDQVELESQDRLYTTAVTCNGKVFFAGGINTNGYINCTDVDIYDKNTGLWTIEHLSEGRHFIGAVANGNKVYFAGGLHYTSGFYYHNVIDVYDTEDEAWLDPPLFLNESKGGVGVATVGSKVFFAGGALSPNTVTNLVEIYDVITGDWTYDTLSQARALPATVAYENKVYVAGGILPNSFSSDVVDIYNVDTETWEPTQALSSARIARALKVLDALVFVGETDYLSSTGSYGMANGIVDIYYPETGVWETLEQNLDPARIMYGCTAYEDKAYIAGGYPGGSSLTDVMSILEYTPPINPFISEENLQNLEVQVFPNPFTSNIQIDINIQYSDNISISIYNSKGELIENKTNISIQPGDIYVISNTDKLKQGVYFCVIKTSDVIQTRKIVKL